jgi:hypothetical protein
MFAIKNYFSLAARAFLQLLAPNVCAVLLLKLFTDCTCKDPINPTCLSLSCPGGSSYSTICKQLTPVITNQPFIIIMYNDRNIN